MKAGEDALVMGERRLGFVRVSAAWLRRSVRRRAWLALLLVSVALLCSGQSSGHMAIHDQAAPDLGDDTATSSNQHFSGTLGDPAFLERRMRQLNEAQHTAMVSDSDRLLVLVKELNAEINSSTPATLTSEQLRKVAEIEKLAHSVKDKMRITVEPVPSRFAATRPASSK
jgi:hypothetical protein